MITHLLTSLWLRLFNATLAKCSGIGRWSASHPYETNFCLRTSPVDQCPVVNWSSWSHGKPGFRVPWKTKVPDPFENRSSAWKSKVFVSMEKDFIFSSLSIKFFFRLIFDWSETCFLLLFFFFFYFDALEVQKFLFLSLSKGKNIKLLGVLM